MSQNQASGRKGQSAPEAYDRVLRLLDSGKASEALEAIDAALSHETANPGLYNLRGLAASRLGRSREAEASFRKVIELSPRSTMGYTNLATLLAQEGRPWEATELFRAALERDPKDFGALVGLGVTLAALQKYAEANPYLEEAWNLQPADFQAGYEYALVLRETHQPEKASKVLTGITPPSQPSAAAKYFNLSAVLAEDEGDRKRAAELYARAYRLAPDSFETYLALVRSSLNPSSSPEPFASGQPEPSPPGVHALPDPPPGLPAEQHFSLGVLLASRGAYRQALPHFEETLRAEPDSYATAFNLALCYKEAGNYEAATDLIGTTLKQKPTAELYSLLASLDEAVGRYLDAAKNYRRAVELEPDNEQYYFDLGAEYLAHFTFVPATETFRIGTQRFPSSARQFLGLGYAYSAERQYPEAAEAFLAALQIDPTSPAAVKAWNSVPAFLSPSQWEMFLPRLRRLAELHPQTSEVLFCYGVALSRWESAAGRGGGDEASSLLLLERAVALRSDFAEARLELANLYAARGEKEKAAAELREVIKLQPDSEMAHYRLGQIYRDQDKVADAQKELALYAELSRHRRQEMARTRSAIKQFVITQSAGTLSQPKTSF